MLLIHEPGKQRQSKSGIDSNPLTGRAWPLEPRATEESAQEGMSIFEFGSQPGQEAVGSAQVHSAEST